ncbi:MAG TPA: Gmad2 immunoglobulin-like domain-containing protein [Acidimicrobiales bacterium]|nr:Gmad2 immunoglobulin-like domain-containing protein [Acidimicrobiales bacterium]
MRRLVFLALTVVALLGLVACGDDTDETTTGDDTTTSTTEATTTTGDDDTTTTSSDDADDDDADETAMVRVYFVLGEHVATAGRDVEAPAVADGAMRALLAGPEGIEAELGMGSEIPEGTELLGVDVADGVATVDLSREFESGGGSLSMTVRVAQVVMTLTQFDTVDSVDIRLDGEPVEAIGGEGVLATGLTRDDVRDQTPLILVESPVPGEEVGDELRVTGISNTFEATVEWVLTDADGLIVGEGFTTATAGTGTWGEFDFTVDVPADTGPRGSIILFESSPRDGSQENVYEVPIRFAES